MAKAFSKKTQVFLILLHVLLQTCKTKFFGSLRFTIFFASKQKQNYFACARSCFYIITLKKLYNELFFFKDIVKESRALFLRHLI